MASSRTAWIPLLVGLVLARPGCSGAPAASTSTTSTPRLPERPELPDEGPPLQRERDAAGSTTTEPIIIVAPKTRPPETPTPTPTLPMPEEDPSRRPLLVRLLVLLKQQLTLVKKKITIKIYNIFVKHDHHYFVFPERERQRQNSTTETQGTSSKDQHSTQRFADSKAGGPYGREPCLILTIVASFILAFTSSAL